MASSSPGSSEWSVVILKNCLSRKSENDSQNWVIKVAKLVESSFATPESRDEEFFPLLGIVLADYFMRSIPPLSLSYSGIITNSCKVIIQSLLQSLDLVTTNVASKSPTSGIIQPIHVLQSLKTLCCGTQEVSDADFDQFDSQLKELIGKREPAGATAEGPKKGRPDLNATLLDQFVCVIPGLVFDKPRFSEQDISDAHTKEASNQNMAMVCSQNIRNLCALNASDSLINLCLSLPHLASYIDRWTMVVESSGLGLPTCLTEAQALKQSLPQLKEDMVLAKGALSLPLLEPLTKERLCQLTKISMGCLLAALSTATTQSIFSVVNPAPSKALGSSSTNIASKSGAGSSSASSHVSSNRDDEWDSSAAIVVESAIEIYRTVLEFVQRSPRGERVHYDNFLYLGAWILLSGLQAQLTHTSQVGSEKAIKEEKSGKSPSKHQHKDSGASRVNLTKVQQGFGVLSVVLTSQALSLLGRVLEQNLVFESEGDRVVPAGLDATAAYTHRQRIDKLFSVPVTQLLYHIGTVSYRRSCNLKRIQKNCDGETVSISDSATYYDDDDFSCSEESSAADDDDDSEPILGHWFEETITPVEPKGSKGSKSHSSEEEGHGTRSCQRNLDISRFIPDKSEPHGYIILATQIFAFMNDHLLWYPPVMRHTSAGLSEHQLALLAAIIKDLDRETARTETGTISDFFGATLGQLYTRFSHALARYTHNLMAGELLSPSLQTALLNHLNINPWSESQDDDWPLVVYPRSLTVLAQVLLSKQRKDKEEVRASSENACLSIWKRLLDTLVRYIENPQSLGDREPEDLNVEHAQLLLFLFHSLQLMQKKSILLLCAQSLIQAAQAAFSIMPLHDVQLMLLARVLLLLEYLIKNLYDAPAAMLEQIQWNLLSVAGLSGTRSDEEGSQPQSASRIFNCCKELEDNYRKFASEDDGGIRPRFYLLSSIESNNQDLPKLDGLACSFLLAPSDSFKYSTLYDSILNILHVVHQCEFHSVHKDKRDYSALCAVQYCFAVAWRLVQCLPPSVGVMENLSSSTGIEADQAALLHALLWGPRSAHKVYNAWITDCLVKQGLTTQKAIFVVKAAAKYANSTGFLVKIAKQLGQGMRESSRVKDISVVPDLWDVLVMDIVIARLRLLYDECANKDSGDESYRVLDSPTDKLPKTSKISKEVFMEICDLVDSVANLSRRCVLHDALGNSTDTAVSQGEGSTEAEALQHLLGVSSTRGCKLANITPALSSCLPPFLRAALDRWNGSSADFPAFFSWGSNQSGDLIPSESYLNGILNAHLQLLSSQPVFSPAASLRHLLNAAVRLANDLVVWYPNTEEAEKELVGVFFPIALDACFENLVDLVQLVMERLVGSADSDRYQDIASYIVISHCHALLTAGCVPVRCLEERALEECVRFLESCVDGCITRHPLSRFYTFEEELHSLWDVVFSTTSPELSSSYRKGVYRFVNKLLKSADSSDADLENLCLTLLKLDKVDEDRLEAWIEFAILRHLSSGEDDEAASSRHLRSEADDSKPPSSPVSRAVGLQDGMSLLQNLTQFAVRKGEGDRFGHTLLNLLLKNLSSPSRSKNKQITPELVVVMVKLAAVGQGSGHRDLFVATFDWILKYKSDILHEAWTELDEEDLANPPPQLASFCCLLQYTTDVINALKQLVHVPGEKQPSVESGEDANDAERVRTAGEGSGRARSPHSVEVEDWTDDLGLEDVESDGDESDEDLLCNKLCTYIITQKEFMNQHWYHCHTCRMVDGVGVCTVCAKVCHRGHDVTYAKFGSFFCDCGAKEDGSCQALVRRPPQVDEDASGSSGCKGHETSAAGQVVSSSGYAPYRMEMEGFDGKFGSEEATEKLRQLARQLEPFVDELMKKMSSSDLTSSIVEILSSLLPAVEKASKRLSPVGSLQRARQTLEQLHCEPKAIVASESLMIPTLGSQEGAFENVRMSFTGDQGQTIRQLLSAHVLRRVSMCCLSSPLGRRQHLAMSHEKGKVTVLQLSTLLKQADASKRKLTLTRLSSAPVPFTVLSMASNPANEDVLAVCGLKECHVLTFTTGGSVQDHLALHPQLETGNFIIKAVWLPGQATQLAVITADFVKIYDLAIDVLSPQYYFLLPSGKVRDCCFMFRQNADADGEGSRFTFFMSSSGYIYWQPLSEESSARHGPFYVTNILDIAHPDVKENNGQTGGGGVSVYFSHSLQLLCFSYAQGKTFLTSVSEDDKGELQAGPLHQIYVPAKAASGGSGGSGSALKLGSAGVAVSAAQGGSVPQQPLCQWAEVAGHPGLLLTLTQSSYTPIIIMVEPQRVLVEEIKVIPAKVKVTDMVAIRHLVNAGPNNSKPEQRTTLILLCDDGSLRIFMASPEMTCFWLSPTIQPPILAAPPPKTPRKESCSAKSPSGASTPTFPTDFFENCTLMNDGSIEFGGNDLLHVYNSAQLKHRLNTTGLYVACTKQTGFSVEITNADSSTVMVGVRVLVGTQDVQRAPSYVELFGRTIPFVLQRHRWFDVPLTKEESLQADKKLVLTFGPSNDALGVAMVDSIKVYGRTKEAFGWPDDADDQLQQGSGSGLGAGPSLPSHHHHSGGCSPALVDPYKFPLQSPAQMTLDKLVGGAVALLEGSVTMAEDPAGSPNAASSTGRQQGRVLDLATRVLALTWSAGSRVPALVKQLLSVIHPTREAFHDHKDRVLLAQVLRDLQAIQDESSPTHLDPEAFYHVLAVTKSVAESQPRNVIRFSKVDSDKDVDDQSAFITRLLGIGKRLHQVRARNSFLSPVGQLGLAQVDWTVQSVVEILFSFALTESKWIGQVMDHYVALLLCDDPNVSYAAKTALQRSMRVVSAAASASKSTTSAATPSAEALDRIPTDEDDIMQLAIAMSLEDAGTPAPDAAARTCTMDEDRIRQLRLALLRRLSDVLPELKKKGGAKSIHFLQVLLVLVSELRPSDPSEKTELVNALSKAVCELNLEREAAQEVAGQRTPQHEVQLLIMKFFGFLLSTHKSKSSGRRSVSSSSGNQPTLALVAARVLLNAGLMERCLILLRAILVHWKSVGVDEASVVAGLLKHPGPAVIASAGCDLSPFFTRPSGGSGKGAGHIFEGFSQLLTEMALRLPYLVKKVDTGVQLDRSWVDVLCEYVAAPTPSAVKRHVRKLLLFHCGSKEQYRQVRDVHTLETHFRDVRLLVTEHGLDAALEGKPDGLVLPYDQLVSVMEHLRICLDMASTRTTNWQLFCQQHNGTPLSFLIQLACFIDEGVCSTLLQLLRYAFCPVKQSASGQLPNQQAPKKSGDSSGDQSGDPWDLDSSCTEGCICGTFVALLHQTVERRLLSRLIFRFLLDCNLASIRWHAHALIHSICRHSTTSQQQDLVALMWSLWSGLQLYGRKAAQFVDLLGYFTIRTPGLEGSLPGYVDRAVALLKEENQLMIRHPNSVLYNSLASVVSLDGNSYYLERDPCLVCSTPEVAFAAVKLTTLKADVRFTTVMQIIKLIGSHVINRFTLRITDIKRTKMVRTINIYYNNRPVQAAVELKNRPGVWHKAKKLSLTPGQTEVKVDLPLPITACNLKIEFAAFYENLHAPSEMLQCPRCSASVPAHPGVCSNCGENVYQCHKCRSINYDEKDPFLCNACGFSKYAKFDLTLSAKPCSTVEPVESEEDRKKALQSINGFLEKADRLQSQLTYSRETLELLVSKLGESPVAEAGEEATAAVSATAPATPAAGSSSSSGQVNRIIQQIAQRYHLECKATFEELSKIAQRVAACRREIVAYDVSQRTRATQKPTQSAKSRAALRTAAAANVSVDDASFGTNVPLPTGATCCFGCACAALDHCLTLLRAMATKPFLRRLMFEQGLLQELLQYNISQGSAQSRSEVRDLLCLLTLNNADAVVCLNQKLMDSVDGVLKRTGYTGLALLNSVRHEMALLAASFQCQDACWEQRLRCVVQLFLKSTHHLESPAVMDVITLPCLRMIEELIQGHSGTSAPGTTSGLSKSSKRGDVDIYVDLKRWLQGDPQHSFDAWKTAILPRYDVPIAGRQPEEVRQLHLMQKFAAKWRGKTRRQRPIACQLSGYNWLQPMLFNPNSRLSRQTACIFLEGLARVPQRRQEVVDLLTTFLTKLGQAGPYGAEFVNLYTSLVRKDHWRYYLVCRGLLPQLAELIGVEINSLMRQEMAGRSSELSQGHALKVLVELLSFFLEEASVRQAYKGSLVGHVLNGYLQLRRLVLQRTRLVEETQDLLLQLLGDMTTGTEAETKQFMAICVQTLRQCLSDDLVTPVFVVERLCSIVHPEEKDDVEFLMSLDKDPQQEDFLQGRMQGNPYSSTELGLGPLMRDVKNKICQDCELIALLEDDTGMELLVCNKIMSLDLPVRDVYRKVWLAESSEQEPMRIVYRMRGLLGDATEEFIERFDDKQQRPTDDEETYRMANVMGECNGLDVLLERLSCVRDIHGEGRPLLGALVKLLSFCVKVQTNRALLISPELDAVQRLLVALKLCLEAQNMPPFTEQLLEVTEAILRQASAQSVDDYARFSSTFGAKEDLDFLLQLSAQLAGSKTSSNILTHLTRVIPFLTFVNDAKMDALIDHFRDSLDFSRYDAEHSQEQATKLELFCSLTSGIEHNAIGNTLKDRLVASKVVHNALEYLHDHAPPVRAVVARDSSEWKDFLAKPSLKFVLRLLTGLAHSHVTTQLALALDSIPLFHHLEQISSEEHVGTLAENLLEAMRGHAKVAELIEEVRQQTKREKKRLAMAMRENQLRALGMRTNEQGQVKAENPILQQLVDMGLGEEPGLVCVICREGYRFQPSRVLAIYTFSRRCQLEDLETQLWQGAPASSSPGSSAGSRGRKTLGYYTVSHFNVVHVECHLAAVRLARARDEWESAALQNANTRCNGLLPLWGPGVPESAFASCLARHNTYLQECTGHRDIGYISTCHDLKMLLLRFATERSFSDESGGGGPQSNLHFLPYLLHVALYVFNTTRSWNREEKNLKGFLDTARGEKWVENQVESESPFYYTTLALLVQSWQRWKSTRSIHLSRLLVAAHCRIHLQKGIETLRRDKQVLEYGAYKPALVFFALVNGIYEIVLKNVSVGDIDSDWPGTVADYIRHNDESVLRATDKLLDAYQNDFLACTSFAEFCDVAGLLEDIPSPEEFIRDLVEGMP